MYFEGGVFGADGALAASRPLEYCTSFFAQNDSQGRLRTLNDLMRLPKAAFLSDNERSYSQSCILFHYLEAREPGVMRALIDAINSGRVRSNDRLIETVLQLTGKSSEALNEAYRAYGREF